MQYRSNRTDIKNSERQDLWVRWTAQTLPAQSEILQKITPSQSRFSWHRTWRYTIDIRYPMQHNLTDINVPTFRYNLSPRWEQIPEDVRRICLWNFDKRNQTTKRRFRKASSYKLALLSCTVAPRHDNVQSRISGTNIPRYRSLCVTCPDTRMWHTWSSHSQNMHVPVLESARAKASLSYYMKIGLFYFCGATTQLRPRQPHCSGL
jgi:hypothetical protein